ncbi:trypsin-like peptidase domain-containing protein [Gordonia sp. PKS22-38]|uniref:Trypsin-like peptidase domain-containing protein n=1 Tax=Gordonia prachuapensis TaxID=3115651 RepID=A0ABU7MQZ6_9ACTN|nr:trypsin-like peptidase domain-containing protein [Gordonia sp. PKS22-38]
MRSTHHSSSRVGVAALAALMAAGAVVSTAPTATADTPPDDSPATRAAAVIRPSIVYLESNVPDVSTSRCTGFVVNPDGYIATAGHCVDPDHVAYGQSALDSGNRTLDRIEATGLHVSVLGAGQSGEDVKPVPARVVDVRPMRQGDVALLKVPLSNLPSSELSTAEPEVGTPVQSIGYPASTESVTDYSLEPTAKSGTVSALKTLGTAPVIEVSAAMSPGMSGGPTITDDGKVLGVNSFRPSGEPGAFNYVSAVTELREMMKNNGVTSELSPADGAYREGLGAYYAGDYDDAIKNFDNSIALSPGYPNAFPKRTEAVRRREAAGEGYGSGNLMSVILIAGGVLVGLALVGWLAYYLYTHRGNRARNDVPPDVLPAGSYPAPQAHSVGAGGQVPPPPPTSGGAVTTSPPAAGARCDNCGFELPPGQAFCGRCGKRQE